MKKAKVALITGITGFAGSHLAEFLLKKEFKVCGLARWRSKTENIEHIKSKLHLFEADLLDSHSLGYVIKSVKPDYIFHLASQSYPFVSWRYPEVTLQVNIVGSCSLFEAVRSAGIDPVIQIACSSEEYGLVYPKEILIKETNPLRPLSPYAVSKVGLDFLGYQYFKSYDMKIIRTRAFNHTGPRRGEVFVCSTFAKQIAEIEKGKKKPVILVGNLDAKRDFNDVRDIIQAYYLAVLKCEPGKVYNICSGKAYSIKQMLDMLLSMTKVKPEIRTDPEKLRPSDVPLLVGDSTKFRRQTGWKPKVPFEKTLKDLLNYWRERI